MTASIPDSAHPEDATDLHAFDLEAAVDEALDAEDRASDKAKEASLWKE